MSKPRPVKIEAHGDTWYVRYLDRKYRGRHGAAQFYAPDNTLEEVKEWVRQNPKLTLIEESPPGSGIDGLMRDVQREG